MTTKLRKNQAGQPTNNGGEFAGKTHDQAADTVRLFFKDSLAANREIADRHHAEDEARTKLPNHIDEFLLGNIDDLNSEQVTTIIMLSEHMGLKPNVAVNDEDDVQLIYAEPTDLLNDNTVRLTLDRDGKVASAGSGEWWEDNDWDDPTLERLHRLGFGGNR